MNERIETLAGELNMALKPLIADFRMEHGDAAEAKLERYLKALYEEKRDKVRLLGRSGGYTENFAGAMQVRGASGESEPESVPAAYQDAICVEARTRRALEAERSQEQAKAQIRAATEALREKARRGEDLTPYLVQLQRPQEEAA